MHFIFFYSQYTCKHATDIQQRSKKIRNCAKDFISHLNYKPVSTVSLIYFQKLLNIKRLGSPYSKIAQHYKVNFLSDSWGFSSTDKKFTNSA